MGENENTSSGATDTSAVTAIKVKVVVDTTTAELENQFKGVQDDIAKDPIGLTFGVDAKTSKDAIIKGLQAILGKDNSINIGASVDQNAGKKVQQGVQNAVNAGQQTANKNKVKIKADAEVDAAKQKLDAFYKRVQEKSSLYKDAMKLESSQANETELKEVKRQLEDVRNEAGRLRAELVNILPTGEFSKISEIERDATNSISRLEARLEGLKKKTLSDTEFNEKKTALFKRAREIGEARKQLESLEQGDPRYNDAVKRLRESKSGYSSLRGELGDKISTDDYSQLSEIFRQNERAVQKARADAKKEAMEAARKVTKPQTDSDASAKLSAFYDQQKKAGTLEQSARILESKNADSKELIEVQAQLTRTQKVASDLRDELSDLLPEDEKYKLEKFDQELEDNLRRITARIQDQEDKATQAQADAKFEAEAKKKISEFNSEMTKYGKLSLDQLNLSYGDKHKNELVAVDGLVQESKERLDTLKDYLADILPEDQLNDILKRYDDFEKELQDKLYRAKQHQEDLKKALNDKKATAAEKEQAKQSTTLTDNLADAKSKYSTDKLSGAGDIQDALAKVQDKVDVLNALKVGTNDYATALKEANNEWANAKRLIDEFNTAQKNTEKQVDNIRDKTLVWKKTITGNTESANQLKVTFDELLTKISQLDSDHSSENYKNQVKELNDAFIDAKASVSAYQSGYKGLESQAVSTLAKIRKVESQLQEAGISKYDTQLKGQPGYTGDQDGSFEGRIRKLNELDSQSQEYHDTLQKIIDDWSKISLEIQNALKSEEDLQKEAEQRNRSLLTVRKAYGSVQKSLNSSAFTLPNSLAKERFDTIKLGGKTGTEAYQELNDAITRLENSKGPVEFKNTLAEVNTLLVEVREHINDATGHQSGSKAFDRQSDNMKNLLRELYSYREKLNGLEKNGDLLKEYEGLYAKINNGSISFEKAQLRVSSFKNACHEANLETETLGQKLSRLFKEHFQTAIAMAGVAMVKQGLREVYNNVLDIDTALTELRKVSSMTSSEMNDFLDRSAVKARELGVSISDLVNSTADWKRLGYTDDDAEELARISSLMVNVGDGIQSIDDASSYLISTMQGFGLAANEAERLLDCMNQIANTEPVSMNDLGLIMQRSSAAMAAAGNTYQETLSMAAAVNGVLQSPETSGTYLKTLSMYLRAAKTDAEDAGIATDGMANSVSELRTELKQLSGVDIMKDNNTFKSTYQIMKELSEVWDSLTDTTQANITELISGKRGGQSTAALLSNFSVAEDSMKQALESSGSAMRENEQYMQSLQAKINQLDAAFQQLSKDLLSSDVPKFFVSLATGAVDLADGAVKAAGALPTLTAAISGVLSVMQMSGKLKNGAGKVNMPSYVRCI